MENKFLDSRGVSDLWQLITAYMEGKIWIGTKLEYRVAAALGEISNGALVIITDESDVIAPPSESNSTTSILGVAKLGEMILGMK